MLLHSGDAGIPWYLDSKTGDFLCEDCCEIPEDPDEAGLLYIEPVPSWEACQEMEDFIETVESEELVEKLLRTIRGRGEFRHFKDVLNEYLQELERWYKFRGAREMERGLEWLEDAGIEPTAPETD